MVDSERKREDRVKGFLFAVITRRFKRSKKNRQSATFRSRLRLRRSKTISQDVKKKKKKKTKKRSRKRRLGEGNLELQPRGVYAIPKRKLRFFFRAAVFSLDRPELGPYYALGFSHALLRNYRCQDYREGRLRLLFCGRICRTAPGPGQDFGSASRVYDSSGF